MDSFPVHLKLDNLKRLGNVIRFFEICLFFIFVSRVSFQFQFQFQFPVGEYGKRLLSILLSHRFVFVIGNVIVITLFAKSGRGSHPDHTPKPDTTPTPKDSYFESIHKVAIESETQSVSTKGATFGTERFMGSVPKGTESTKRVWDEKRSVRDGKFVKVPLLENNKACFMRSYSKCMEVEQYIKPRRILRRTATEGCCRSESGGRCGDVEALEGCGDGMSDEEFRVMVETFIEKQQRSLREEEKRLSFC